MTKTVDIPTDGNGYYHQSQTFAPPGPFGFTVDIFATLILPAAGQVQGTVELDAPSGTAPQSKTFVAASGQKISLGSWHVPHGNNVLVISGQTVPAQPNVNITAQVEADLAHF